MVHPVFALLVAPGVDLAIEYHYDLNWRIIS